MPQAKISELSQKIALEIMSDTKEKKINIIERALIFYKKTLRLKKLSKSYEKLTQDKKKMEKRIRRKTNLRRYNR